MAIVIITAAKDEDREAVYEVKSPVRQAWLLDSTRYMSAALRLHQASRADAFTDLVMWRHVHDVWYICRWDVPTVNIIFGVSGSWPIHRSGYGLMNREQQITFKKGTPLPKSLKMATSWCNSWKGIRNVNKKQTDTNVNINSHAANSCVSPQYKHKEKRSYLLLTVKLESLLVN